MNANQQNNKVNSELESSELDDSIKDENSLCEDPDERVNPIKLVLIILFIIVGSSVSYLLSKELSSGHRYVEKAHINEQISTLVNNGAGLRAVRFLYEHRRLVRRNIFLAIRNDNSVYYFHDVALSEILEQLRTDQYLVGNLDEKYLDKLNDIIRVNNESNPFDKLEPGQKDLFENIRVKLDGNYSLVADDVNKLSDELSNKNRLVNEYLADSQTSLVVSIVSALIALVLAGVQMWQNRNSQKNSLHSRIARKVYEKVLSGEKL